MLVAAITAASLPAAFAAFAGRQSILSRQHLSVSLSHAGVARAVVGSAPYLVLVGMRGLGLGALIRNAAGGIAALFGLLYGIPLGAAFLPDPIAADLTKYLPAGAGHAPRNRPMADRSQPAGQKVLERSTGGGVGSGQRCS